jgi:hypothetical protein
MTDPIALKEFLQQSADSLSGYHKRLFMARTVRDIFEGKPYRAQRILGWNRETIDKGLRELTTGIECIDGRRGLTGRKPIEHHFPTLREDIRDICESQCQTDARFRTQRLYRRITTKEVRKQLVEQKGYDPETLPCEETVRLRLNELGYFPARVQKTLVKKSPANGCDL